MPIASSVPTVFFFLLSQGAEIPTFFTVRPTRFKPIIKGKGTVGLEFKTAFEVYAMPM